MMMRSIIILWFATIVSDAITSALAAGYMFRLRQRFGIYIAMALLGTALESVIALVSIALWSGGPVTTPPWIIIMRIVGRLFKTATMSMLALYVLGYINGQYAPKIHPPLNRRNTVD